MLRKAALLAATACVSAHAATPSRILRAEVVAHVNVRDILTHAAPRPSGRRIEMPRHKLPFPDFANSIRPEALSPAPNVSIVQGLHAGGKSTGFTGIYEGSNAPAIGGDLEPPDQGLAVGNGMVAEVVNDTLQVFDEAGTPQAAPASLYSVLVADPSAGVGDPHIEYDASVNRWFIDTYYQTASFNGFLLGVSSSGDPLGGYTVYRVDADSANVKRCQGSCFPDYPQPGYDANGYYIAADLFSNTTGHFVAAGVYALPKAQLIAGVPLAYQYFLLPDFVVEPAIPAVPGGFETAQGGTEYFLTARNIYDRSTNLRLYAITNTSALGGGAAGGSPTGPLTAYSTTFPAQAYGPTVPSVQPNQVGPYGKSVGATASPTLDGGYQSFGSGVKLYKGSLYAALATGATDGAGLRRDVIAWFAVKPALTATGVSASITAQGYVVPPAGYSLSYPGIALDARGQGILGTTITNPDSTVPGGYPSTGYVRFKPSGPGGRFVVTGQGAATDDGFTGYTQTGQATVGRWGDFSAATIDPATGEAFIGNEFIPDDSVYPRTSFANWGTFITGVK